MMRLLAWSLTLSVVRSRRAWGPVAGWALFAMVSALGSRVIGAASGADHVLRGAFGAIALPLLAFSVVSAFVHGGSLTESTRGLLALGASRRHVAMATTLVSVGLAASASATLAALVCVLAHGPADAPLARDALSSFGVALLGGGAYAAWFLLGSLTRRGALRSVLLVLDWGLGMSQGPGAWLTPRAHIASLLGGPSCFELSRRGSSLALVGLTVLYLLLVALWGRRWSRG
jgi:hypothetical protein